MTTAAANLPSYNVTKTFTSGLLKGITIIETTKVLFQVGQSYKTTTSVYLVTAVVEV